MEGRWRIEHDPEGRDLFRSIRSACEAELFVWAERERDRDEQAEAVRSAYYADLGLPADALVHAPTGETEP